ncbi:QsdR family transcriptional regulator [Nocardia jejuensis]|uniref:QsdR family transcriptional regulator n=1 Tax=Nocardia jejuensis TaxID=328049 RepID=UPI001471ADAB|nr:QsdR family transcriptional regulator [Nocardia jejuensis]
MTVSNTGPGLDGVARKRRSTGVRPTDDSLLDGVVAVFAEHGFDRATMDELAVAADTSKPTLYSHFGGKEQLFEACVRREAERLRGWMLQSYRRADGFGIERQTDITTHALFDFAARHDQGFRLLFGSATRPHARQISDGVLRPIVAKIAELIRVEHQKDERVWAASADFCAAVVADIAVRGVTQAVERRLDVTAAAELTISMTVAALRQLDPDAARALDRAAGPAMASDPAASAVVSEAYPPLRIVRTVPEGRPVGRPPTATVDQVLDTAIRIFGTAERFEAGSVAIELGMSRTTLYRWFGSREGLLGAALARQFEQLVIRIDSRRDSRGVLRISEVLDRATRSVAADPALRRFLENESGPALRLITRADGPVHAGSVAVIRALIDRAREQDGYRPPVDGSVLAYSIARVAEAFLYDDTAGDIRGDVEHLRQVQRTLLGIDR